MTLRAMRLDEYASALGADILRPRRSRPHGADDADGGELQRRGNPASGRRRMPGGSGRGGAARNAKNGSA